MKKWKPKSYLDFYIKSLMTFLIQLRDKLLYVTCRLIVFNTHCLLKRLFEVHNMVLVIIDISSMMITFVDLSFSLALSSSRRINKYPHIGMYITLYIVVGIKFKWSPTTHVNSDTFFHAFRSVVWCISWKMFCHY